MEDLEDKAILVAIGTWTIGQVHLPEDNKRKQTSCATKY